jgi:hypothetical protein
MSGEKRRGKETLGFGFQPSESEHFFLVTLPASKAAEAQVTITEHFEWSEPSDASPISILPTQPNIYYRATLARSRWEEIADEIKAEFNRRLRGLGLKVGKWPSRGQVPVDRTLGKELVLLAWAIEDCDPALIPDAIRNWLGLVPEERWWLYTMTAASTGHAINGRNKGWRKAVRFALTENPVTEAFLARRLNEFELTGQRPSDADSSKKKRNP